MRSVVTSRVLAGLSVVIVTLCATSLAATPPGRSSVSAGAVRFSDRAVKLTLPTEDPCTLIISQIGYSDSDRDARWGEVIVDREKLLLGMCGYLQTQLSDWASAQFEDLTQFEARKKQFESTVEAAKRELMNHFLSWVAEIAHGQLLPGEQAQFNLADEATRHLLATEWLARPSNEIQTYVLVFLERQSGPLARLFKDYVNGSSMEIWGGLKGLHDDAAAKLKRFMEVSYDVEQAEVPYADALREHGFDGPWVERFQAWEGEIRTLDDAYSVVDAGQIIVTAFRTDKPREKIAGLFELLALIGDTAGDSKIPIVSFFGDVVSAYAAVAQEMLTQIEGLEGKIRTREGYCIGLAAHAMSDERDIAFRAQFGEGIRACPATLSTLPFKNIYLQAQPDNANQLYFWVDDTFVEGQPRGGGLPAVRQVIQLIARASDLQAFTRFSQDATDLDVISRIYNTSYESEHGVGIPGLLKAAETTVGGIIDRLGALSTALDPYGAHACSGDALHDYLAARVEGRVPSRTELEERRDEYVVRFAMRYILAQHRGLGSEGPKTLEQLWGELRTLSLLQIRGAVRSSEHLAAPCVRCGGAELSISLTEAEQIPGCEVSAADAEGGFVLHLLTRSPDYQAQVSARVEGRSGQTETVDRRAVVGTDAVPFVARFDPLLLGVPLADEEDDEEPPAGCEDVRVRLQTTGARLEEIQAQLDGANSLLTSAETLQDQVSAAERHEQQAEDEALAVVEAKQEAETLSAGICTSTESLGDVASEETAGAQVLERAKTEFGVLERVGDDASQAFERAVRQADEAERISEAAKNVAAEVENLRVQVQELGSDLDGVRQLADDAEAFGAATAEGEAARDECADAVRAMAQSLGQRLAGVEGLEGSVNGRLEEMPDTGELAGRADRIANAALDARAAANAAEVYLEALKQLILTADQCLGAAHFIPVAEDGTTVRVPVVEGQKLAVARDILAAAGLEVQLVAGAPATSAEEEGTVHTQQPAPGEAVARGAVVVIGVRGPYVPAAVVPDVRDRLLADAKGRLEAAGLGWGLSAGSAASSQELEGTVESQDPPPGVQVQSDTLVTLTIRGPYIPVTTVPDVLDHYLPDARAMLEAASLGSSFSAGPPAEQRDHEGTVKTQQPPPGAVVERGTVVALTVRGPVGSGVEVPNVTGVSADIARSTLRAAGLTVVEQESGTARSERESRAVASQDPPAGATVQPGAAVTLFVLGPYRPAIVPPVVPPVPAQRQWVLVRTTPNPTNEPLQKHLIENTYLNNTVSDRSFTFGVTGDGPENFVLRADFEPPPQTLTPGSSVSLRARVSGRGRITGSYATFVYGAVLGRTRLGEANYKIDARLVASDVVLSFTVPPVDQQEMTIIAMFTWTSGTRVDWVYRAQ